MGGFYASASVIGDVKRFSGDAETNVLDGEGFGGSVAIGSSVGSRWDVEVGVDLPRVTEVLRPRSVTVRREILTFQSRTRNRTVSVPTLIRYRPAPRGRRQLGYLAGMSFVRLERRFDTQGPEGAPASLIPRPQDLVDYGAAPTVGVDARIGIGERLSIVPAIHVSAFTLREVSGVFLRPRIGLRWQF